MSATTLGAAKWTIAFAILGLAPAGGRNSILWTFTSSGFQFPTCLHVEWAFLPSTTPQLLLQYLVTFSSQGQKSPTLLHVDLSLITFCLRTCFLPREFIHVFSQQTFIDTFIMCHLFVLGTWNVLMNRRDKNPCPPEVLRCS